MSNEVEVFDGVGPLLVDEADPVTGPIDVRSIRVAVARPALPGPVPAPRAVGPSAPWLWPVTPKVVRRRLVELDRMDAA